MHSQVLFWCLFIELRNFKGMHTKITLEWVYKQSVMIVYRIYFLWHFLGPWIMNKLFTPTVSHSDPAQFIMGLSYCLINSLKPSDAYKCVGKLTIIGSDNGLSPGRRQAIIWTNASVLFIGPLGANFSEIILVGIQTFSFKKMHLKMSSAKRRLFCLGLNVLIHSPWEIWMHF